MNLLFIITGSIAAIKCKNIINQLTNKNIFIDLIITNNARKIIDINSLKKRIRGKI